MRQKIKKYIFYIYIAAAAHLLGFIVFLQDPQNIQMMQNRVNQQPRLNFPGVKNIILESFQDPGERPREFTPYVSENFSTSSGRMTQEQGYNVTEDPTPSQNQNNRNRSTRQMATRSLPREENPDILLRPYQSPYPRLNVPRLKTRDHNRFVLNFNKDGMASFATRAFPNVKYFIDIAKTSWQYLVQFAPSTSIGMGALKNSAVLLGFTIDRQGNIKEIWVVDSTNSETLNALSKRAIEFIKTQVGGFGRQPDNYDIKVIYAYFYIGRDLSGFGDENQPIFINLQGAFYFEYKNLKDNRR